MCKFKHAPFCHISCSYNKRETDADRNNNKILDAPVANVLSLEDLLSLLIIKPNFEETKCVNCLPRADIAT